MTLPIIIVTISFPLSLIVRSLITRTNYAIVAELIKSLIQYYRLVTIRTDKNAIIAIVT